MGERAFRVRNIGFISTRIAGTDGVSLEITKWAQVLERNGFRCFYLAGECDREKERCLLVNEAHFLHPEIEKITAQCFGQRTRPREISRRIHDLRVYFKEEIYEFVKRFEIDLIIAENVLAIPLNIPLGLALVEFIAESGIPTIAHHHDFSWERDRFLINSVEDYLSFAFPPNLPGIRHAVINSIASHQLSYRKGISNTIVPNVYDFATPPPAWSDSCKELREEVGLDEKDVFVLQPTRIVPRKWIERSVEIVNLMMLRKPVLVVSHSAEDEGDVYYRRVSEYAHNLGVKLVSIEHLVGENASSGGEGGKRYTISDVYHCADLVCYPSGYEGFGNAFLEAIYHRKPIVVNRYSIYVVDIEPKGFDVISIEGFVSSDTIRKIYEVLNDEERREEMTRRNYELGKKHFSYEVLERLLLHMVGGLERQSESQEK
ncbi:MAG: glycosyltransferase family 4 protein [Deltaproteobacteria bacterium]|nr:glycosyltransferase family 4 protein [Deltaproteobacteria bacterium]MBW1920908.1 glycosyltransferase family 4 protein [Deltaproteobacteria bacterium]MBW1935726.1 glycosyltransferase family 4 protein [Deltaproteobacteria bacterium]MBW1977669.1 glycosyltransferase family 4 protein [Deltaproteobacteria bacterium]MBW2045406.1 glycosyltransferase family 4 protein [Deltaproteobacteria bacterium]